MPKTCPQCQSIHSGVAVRCECGCDLSGVASVGPMAAPLPARAAPFPAARAVGLVGCLLAAVGGFLPLVSTDVRREGSDGGVPTVRGVDHNWFAAPAIGNCVLGLAVAGAVLLAGGHPGVAAGAGAGLVAFVAPLPFQVRGGKFGYLGWAAVVVGGALLTGGGVVEALGRADPSPRAGGEPAGPGSVSSSGGS